jgi:hypothetical protein
MPQQHISPSYKKYKLSRRTKKLRLAARRFAAPAENRCNLDIFRLSLTVI